MVNLVVLKKLACVLLMSMVVGALLAQAAVTCGQVVSNLQPCIPYLTTKGVITPACCGGVKSLNSAASTPTDRKQVCNCLKSTASSVSGLNYNLAAGLPSHCGVIVPYKINLKTDCASVK